MFGFGCLSLQFWFRNRSEFTSLDFWGGGWGCLRGEDYGLLLVEGGVVGVIGEVEFLGFELLRF